MKEYTVVIGGLEHTVQLTDEEARARGLTAAPKSAPVSNKARRTSTKAEQ